MNEKAAAASVWVVDDDSSIAWVLEKALTRANHQVTVFSSAETALVALEQAKTPPDVILSDIRMTGMDGFELADRVGDLFSELPIIIMTAYGDLDSAVDAYKHGAFEYLTKPFDITEMLALVERALEKSGAGGARLDVPADSRTMLGESASIQEVFRIIGRLSSSDMNVLIRGESGTGKELVAEAIYRNSPRANKPMVAINTAAIPADLLESELFGHEKGAFTGAHNRHTGRFEQADGGTLFLDEIGDMPAGLQTRLLRVLSEGRFFRVGGREEVFVDVRVIAATNQNLESMVAGGSFRSDLFYRLNVISVYTPPLRERRGDIPLLINHFMNQVTADPGSQRKQCTPEVIQALQNYDWPGNVRELENLIRRLAVLAPSNTVQLDDLSPEILGRKEVHDSWEKALEASAMSRLRAGETELTQALGARFEKVLINAALGVTGGHKQKASRLLGWGRNTLTRKIHQLGIDASARQAKSRDKH